jgi:hypothetical protein
VGAAQFDGREPPVPGVATADDLEAFVKDPLEQ